MNTENVRAKHSIGAMFIFLLIGAFAVFLLLLVLIGAGAYRNTVEGAYSTGQVRASLGYIANKVRAADQAGGVSIERWNDTDALLIREWHDGRYYNTRIYYMPNADGTPGGGLFEQFAAGGEEWPHDEGDRIANIGSLDMREDKGLLSLSLQTEDGLTLPLHIRLHAAAR